MPYKIRRSCPICGKLDLLYLADHLRQVHQLSRQERQPWLKAAVFTPTTPYRMLYPLSTPQTHGPLNHYGVNTITCLESQPYPEFTFQHPFSMMVVGPSQCGKTHFVQQLLTSPRIAFPDKKPVKVYWFYNQWQPIYEDIQRVLKKNIRFAQGLPELSDDLHEIKPAHYNMIVLDDLMAEAKDSPVVSKLFTQGRHRNASVILLLQNLFPKGKYNTDISRNALYKVLFRSPGDRKQIDIMAEQTFAKHRPQFMKAYTQETETPHGYIIVDNHPRTMSHRQVVANVFGECESYPCSSTPSPPSVDVSEESYESVVKKPKRNGHPEKQKNHTTKRQNTVKVVKRPKRRTSVKRLKKKPVQVPRQQRETFEEESGDESYEEEEERSYDGSLSRWIPWEEVPSKDDSEDEPLEDYSEEEDESLEKEYSDGDPSEEETSEGTWHYPKNRQRFLQPPPRTGFGPRCIY